MRFLFVFYISGGGVDALNRYRCQALKQIGHEGHCLYFRPGPGMQNYKDEVRFVTDSDEEIRQILLAHQYDAIVVTTEHRAFERFRQLGYTGKMVLEIQGYGPKSQARKGLTEAVPYVNAYASGLLNPHTRHISELYEELFPHIPKFYFNNPFDTGSFAYIQIPAPMTPIAAWVGRVEDNKNWREFLVICYYLLRQIPNLQIWIYEDPTFTSPAERADFHETIYQLGLFEHITFYQNVPHSEMRAHYSMIGDSGGLMISTSKEEGAPYSFIEAMNCRCPVLSSEKDGIYQSIIYGQTGKMYPLGQVTAAVNEALDLIRNSAMRQYILANAQRHVAQNFSLQAYAGNFMNMIHSLP